MEVLKPGEICTETYILIGAFDTEIEANNQFKYLKTCFCRYMIAQVTSTQYISRLNFCYVPSQNYTNNLDIDWSKSIE